MNQPHFCLLDVDSISESTLHFIVIRKHSVLSLLTISKNCISSHITSVDSIGTLHQPHHVLLPPRKSSASSHEQCIQQPSHLRKRTLISRVPCPRLSIHHDTSSPSKELPQRHHHHPTTLPLPHLPDRILQSTIRHRQFLPWHRSQTLRYSLI